jgi:hypothetical protein
LQCLAGSDDDQQAPEVVAVLQLREAAALRPAAEAVEGAESGVLLVGGAAGPALELLAGQRDQSAEVALPQLLGNGLVAALQQLDPAGDRPCGRHRQDLRQQPWR